MIKMYLKIVGLCVIVGIIIENVEARHLSGGRFPPLLGRQRLQFSSPFGNSLARTHGFGQANFPLRRARRLARFPGPPTFDYGSLRTSPFRPQLRSSRFSPRSFGGLSDLNPTRGQIRRFGRPSSQVGPPGLSLRRRIPAPVIGSGPRVPFAYYGRQNRRQNIPPRSLSRGRTLPRDIINQLRQRFGSISGRGTRDNPIRIRSSRPSISGASPGGLRPQPGQGIRQSLQRTSGQQSRRVQLSRARQPLQPRRQEEVIALLGFDQPAGGSIGLPTLSETVDKQVQVQRTPIKKSPTPESKSAKVPAKSKETKAQNSEKISEPITDAFLQKLDIHQLEKLANGGIAEVLKTQSAQTSAHVDSLKEATKQADVGQVHDVTSQSEIKHVAQIARNQKIISAVKPLSQVKADAIQASSIDAPAETSIDTIKADNININIDVAKNASVDVGHTGNDIANTAGIKSISSTDKTSSSGKIVDNVGVPVPVELLGEQLLKTAAADHISEPVAIYAEHSHIELPAKRITTDPAGISVIADQSVSSETAPSAELVIPVETTVTSEIVVPVESAPAAEIIVSDSGSTSSETIVPIETVPSSETVDASVIPVESASTTEVIIPVESISTSEVITQAESAPTSEVIIPAESAAISELIIPVESASISEVIIPVESASASEVIIPVESASISEVIIPVESASASEVIIPVESAPTSKVIIPNESAPTSEVMISVESAPTSGVIIPVETSLASEANIPVEAGPISEVVIATENAPSSKVTTPVKIVSSSDIGVLTETTSLSETIVPVENAASTEVVVPDESTSVADIIIPVDITHSAESVVAADIAPSSEILVPVEITSETHAIVTSENVVPAETVAVSESVVPAEHVLTVEAAVQTDAVPIHTEQHTNTSASKSVSQSSTSELKTKPAVLS